MLPCSTCRSRSGRFKGGHLRRAISARACRAKEKGPATRSRRASRQIAARRQQRSRRATTCAWISACRGGTPSPGRCPTCLPEQAAGDHLGLDLRGTLEDVEDARVAEDAADVVFQRKAVAAMDLQ